MTRRKKQTHTHISTETLAHPHSRDMYRVVGDSLPGLCTTWCVNRKSVSHTLTHPLTSHCRWGGMFRIWIFRLLQRWERKSGFNRPEPHKYTARSYSTLICCYLKAQIHCINSREAKTFQRRGQSSTVIYKPVSLYCSAMLTAYSTWGYHESNTCRAAKK